MPRRARTSRLPLFDAGWLFLIAGLGLLASGVIIPAARDLEQAHWRRDRALRTEMHRLHRLTRHEAYLEAVRDGDEAVALQLATTQLGLARAGADVLSLPAVGPASNASVFVSLEPPPIELPALREPTSILSRLANSQHTRLWVMAVGSMLVLIGLLPPSLTGRGHGGRATVPTQ